MIFREDERIAIKEWIGPGGRISTQDIDTTDINQIVGWCRAYAKNPPVNDTRDLLVRWNIGMYQLHYVYVAMSDKRIKRELLASAASAMLHMMMVNEEIRGNLLFGYRLLVSEYPMLETEDIRSTMGRLLKDICAITRQMIYWKMRRKNRFDVSVLMDSFIYVFRKLFMIMGEEWSIALSIAMGQLQDIELNQH